MSENNPERPLTIRHWLLQTVITSAIVSVAILALGALFLPDGIANLGQSPAINANQELIDTQELHQRIATLEKQLQHNLRQKNVAQNNDTNLAVRSEDAEKRLQQTTQAAKEYEQRMRALQEEALRESHMARMMMGISQLKTAYENDVSLENGINLLKSTIQDKNLQEKLSELDGMAQEKLPTKQEILTYIHVMQDGQGNAAPQQTAQNNAASPAQNDASGNWMDSLKQRAQDTIGQFVQVRPTADVQQGKILDRIAQAVHVSNYSLAAQLSDSLPRNANTQLLSTKLNARAKAESLIRGLASGVANNVSSPNARGALY